MRKMRIVGMCALLAGGVACSHHPEEGTLVSPGTGVVEVPGGGKHVQRSNAYPIMGGTLAISNDGARAVASDADRDTIFLVKMSQREVTPIALDHGEVPGRIAIGGDVAFVVLRQSGQIARIDLENQRLLDRFSACGSPRGVAVDEAAGLLYVACQDGALLTMDASTGERLRQIYVADDLRDVVISGDRLVVTTFRKAQIFVVDKTGQITQKDDPVAFGSAVPTVAWRAVAGPDGNVKVVHQVADTSSGVSTGASGYSGGFGPCSSSIVTPAVTTISADASGELTEVRTGFLSGAAGPTDIAISPQGEVAVVVAGNAWGPLASVMYFAAFDDGPDCGGFQPESDVGEPVAVAFDNQGQSVVQSREPAALYLEGGETILLSAESKSDTGLALFHMNTGSGIACASCHPEATEDGQTWMFQAIGPRRTQMIAGGLSRRAPFHWDGDMTDFDMLVDEVMVGRMSLPVAPNRAQTDAFFDWLDSVEAPKARVADADAVSRGEALFFDKEVGCNECHTGDALTNNRLVDVGTLGSFVVPSLVGIGSRAPYMHDGCAPTLKDRFGPCGGGDMHGKTSQLTVAQVDDLVAYLETL